MQFRRAWETFWVCMWSAILGMTILRNFRKYKDKSFNWKIGKSLFDFVVLAAMTFFLPPLLIATNVSWFSSKFDKKWQRVIVGLFVGTVMLAVSTYCTELMVLMSIWSVDEKTGPERGAIYRWNQSKTVPVEIAAAA